MLGISSKSDVIIQQMVEHAALVEHAGEILSFFFMGNADLSKSIADLDEVEESADKILKNTTKNLAQAFIVLFDKEDIKEWVEIQDDIIDSIQKILYLIEAIECSDYADYTSLISLIKESCHKVHEGTQLIQEKKINSREFEDVFKFLFETEQKGDDEFRTLQIKVFKKHSGDELFKNKSLLDTLEFSLNRFEKIANIYQTLKFKYS